MVFAAGVQIAAVFIWLGMVIGISFIEAPLKFQAPGITNELGVGIGRLVFRALNIAEGVLLVVVFATLIFSPATRSVASWSLAVALAVILALGALVVRPAIDRNVQDGKISTSGVPRNVLHFSYVGLELIKLALLVIFGVSLLV